MKIIRIKTNFNLSFFSVLFLFSVFFTGCVANKKNGLIYEKCLESGDYAQAASFCEKDAVGADMLANLNYGYALRCNKNYEKSIDSFDKAEALFKATEEDYVLHSSEKIVASALINEKMTSYTGKLYEITLANVYKSICFLNLGKIDLARVEINRALDRQRRAKEFFSSELDHERELAKKKNESNSTDESTGKDYFNEIDKSENVQKELAKHYSNMSSFEIFANYTNPFVTYFAGIYSMLSGDSAKAVDLLKEASAMAPDNKYLQDDLVMAYQVSKSIEGNSKSGSVSDCSKNIETSRFAWIFFENGAGPSLDSLTIPIPLILVSTKAPYTEIALPIHKDGNCALPGLPVATSREHLTSETLSDMNAVALTEFKSRFSAVLIRSIVSASVKGGMQAVAHKFGGNLGALAMGVYTAVVTDADTRHWSALPARYELVRVRMDGTNGEVTLGPVASERKLNLDPARNHLVFVSMRTASSPLSIDSVAF